MKELAVDIGLKTKWLAFKTLKRLTMEQGMFKKFNELHEIKGHNPCQYTGRNFRLRLIFYK